MQWTEKYRPRTMEEVSSQESVVETIKSFMEKGQLPHLLFYGPPGTGKTSLALATVRAFYGTEHCRQNVLELNASDARGIDTVRNEVKTFVSARSFSDKGPRLKIVILDEADQMTSAAQNALRRIVEGNVKHARFFILCNYVTKIIPALQSRCTKFRFRPLERERVEGHLRGILQKESVEAGEDAIDELLAVGGGDMRNILNVAQSVSAGSGVLTVSGICAMSGRPTPSQTGHMMELLLGKSTMLCYDYMENIRRSGNISVREILFSVVKRIRDSVALDSEVKRVLFVELAEIENSVSKGCSEQVMLCGVIGCFQRGRLRG
ncbi:MAG: replication factor C subunit 5 [Amphiamblys sp. WSBS2006]|nr:MAG: replication factor C subunit 5 [Amphiamblys sp. WSBS2006]